jgi:biotin carboxylase
MNPLTVLFLSSSYKGDVMLQTVKQMGCRVILLTEESLKDEPWPLEAIDYLIATPDLRRYQDVINTVTYMCRGWEINHILPLDEFDVELVALLREHLRLPGMGVTAVRNFRDKLVMREKAQAARVRVPEFTQVLNYDKLRAFMDRVPAPWVLKPRTEAGSMGITKPQTSEQVWRRLDELGDRQSYFLLEQFIPGDVYHVDSLTVNKRVVFVSAQKYGQPPLQVYSGGGVFASRILPRDTQESRELVRLNEQIVVETLGMVNGVTHAEFIRSHEDGEFYFLEVAARVGGAFIADMLEQATGFNPWREWGRLEIALLRGDSYEPPPIRGDYGGLLVTLARQEQPDLSAYDAPEVVWKAEKPYHAVLVLQSPDAGRIETLLNDYAERFVYDFSTSAPPKDATRTGMTG